jgi:hypothetical protein
MTTETKTINKHSAAVKILNMNFSSIKHVKLCSAHFLMLFVLYPQHYLLSLVGYVLFSKAARSDV